MLFFDSNNSLSTNKGCRTSKLSSRRQSYKNWRKRYHAKKMRSKSEKRKLQILQRNYIKYQKCSLNHLLPLQNRIQDYHPCHHNNERRRDSTTFMRNVLRRKSHSPLHYLINKSFLCSISNYQLLSNRYPWIHQQCTPHTHSLVVPIPMLTCISALRSSRTSLGPIGRCK